MCDTDDRVVVHVVDAGQFGWRVLTGDGEYVGSVVGAMRTNWRGRSRPRGLSDPPVWEGWVILDDKNVAYIRNATVVDAATRTQVAKLTWGPKPFWMSRGTWMLSISDDVELRLRIMALGWLGAAFDMTHQLENRAGE